MMTATRIWPPAPLSAVLLCALAGVACAQDTSPRATGIRLPVQGLDDASALVVDGRVTALEGPFERAELPGAAMSPPPSALHGGYVDLDGDGRNDPYLLANPGTANVQAHYWQAQISGDARYLGEFPVLRKMQSSWRAVVRNSATSYSRRDYVWTQDALKITEYETVELDLPTGNWRAKLVIADKPASTQTLTEREAINRVEAW